MKLSPIIIPLLVALLLTACKSAAPETPDNKDIYLPAVNSSDTDTSAASAYIRIVAPANSAAVDTAQPITVSGMGAGLFEGNVVVQVVDAAGEPLAMQPTTLQSPDAGTGGEGPWSLEVSLSVNVPTEAKIVAFSPSPKDGEDWLARDEIAITLQPAKIANASLENTPWLLRTFSQAEEYNPLLTLHQATAVFDPAENRLSGSTGCNNYHTTYTVDGNALTLKTPMAMTRMMCDQPQNIVETTFAAAMENVASYTIYGDKLTLLDAAGMPVMVFQVDPYSQSKSFSREELGNATYISDFGEHGTVQLNGGQYRAPAAEDSASEKVVSLSNFAAFGDLDGDKTEEAAVILVSSGGGSGVFYHLAVVKKLDDTLTNTSTAPLGDRVQIKDLQIVNGEILVSLLDHAPDDALCCPTQNTVLRYHLVGGQLVLAQMEADK